jgi:SAM-dependent methyltransferase
MNDNVRIWDDIYRTGNFLSHPTEAFIRLVLEHERHEGFDGIVLDHGCGSGVNSEFLIRRGHNVICSEVSENALEIVSNRFNANNLPTPNMSRFEPNKSLSSQLSDYDHLVAWCSLLYNTSENVQRNIAVLIENMTPGGCFICAIPTLNDLTGRFSEILPDGGGSRRIVKNFSGQQGLIITLPENEEQFVSWCKGIEIRDVGQYSITLGGLYTEVMTVYGVKPM